MQIVLFENLKTVKYLYECKNSEWILQLCEYEIANIDLLK